MATTVEEILGVEEAPVEETGAMVEGDDTSAKEVEEMEDVDFPEGVEVTLDTQKYLWVLGHLGMKIVVYSWDELLQLVEDWIAFQDDLRTTYAARLDEVYNRNRTARAEDYEDEEEEVGTGPTTEQWRTIFSLGNQKGVYVKRTYPHIGEATPSEVQRIIDELEAMPDRGAKDEDTGPSRLRKRVKRARRR